MRPLWLAVALLLGLGSSVLACASDAPETAVIAKEFGVKAAAAEKANAFAIAGKEGWLFFAPELRYLSVGRFWGEEAAKASRAQTPLAADPLPAILDFKAQLDKIGVDLLLVPVPAKAQIYPEFIADSLSLPLRPTPLRLDAAQEEFYQVLRAQGVRVLDLTPMFLQHRSLTDGALYCRQDTHWSGRACVLAAHLIAQEIGDHPWKASAAKRTYVAQPETMAIKGDLWEMRKDPKIPQEKLPLTVVKEKTSAGLAPVGTWRESPVVLLGDSHNLIFSVGGDMLIAGAGLPDHLARELGFPVDLVAVRGSGATPARINLLRRRDNLAGKKLVIWCFTVREFTEGQGWKQVPVVR